MLISRAELECLRADRDTAENVAGRSIHERASQALSSVCEDVMCYVIVGERESQRQLECRSWEGCAGSLGGGEAMLDLRAKAAPALCPHIQQTCLGPGGCCSTAPASWGQTEVAVIVGSHPQGPQSAQSATVLPRVESCPCLVNESLTAPCVGKEVTGSVSRWERSRSERGPPSSDP